MFKNNMPSLKVLQNALEILALSAERERQGDPSSSTMEHDVNNVLQQLGVRDLGDLQTLRDIGYTVSAESTLSWKFVCTTLHILLLLKNALKCVDSEPVKDKCQMPRAVFGMRHQSTIETCLQFVVTMGLHPYFLPGVQFSTTYSTTSAIKMDKISATEKYERLAAVTRGLLTCCDHHCLQAIIVDNHLCDILSALLQLGYTPLKDPVICKPQRACASTGQFVMTAELWEYLQRDQNNFQRLAVHFMSGIYQPLLFRALFRLFGVKQVSRNSDVQPAWFKKICIHVLVLCLLRPNGVSSYIRAMITSNFDSGRDWKVVEIIVQLVTTPHTTPEIYYENIINQILNILMFDERNLVKPYSILQVQVLCAIKCMKTLHELEPKVLMEHLDRGMLKVLHTCCTNNLGIENGTDIIVPETSLTQCIVFMHRIFIDCTFEDIGLPCCMYMRFLPLLFKMYCIICEESCFLTSKLQKLLEKALSTSDSEFMSEVFKSLLFDKFVKGLNLVQDQCDFVRGSHGGIEVRKNECTPEKRLNLEKVALRGRCLLHLVTLVDTMGDILSQLFQTLLNVVSDYTEYNNVTLLHTTSNSDESYNCFVQHSVAIELLNALTENHVIHERMNDDPDCLVNFLLFIMQKYFKDLGNGQFEVCEEETAIEDFSTVLMIISVTIGHCLDNTITVPWNKFDKIVNSLKRIIDIVDNRKLKILANDVYNVIVSRGVIRNQEETELESRKFGREENGEMSDEIGSEHNYELNSTDDMRVAIKYVCSSCVVVHGHGLVELTKMLKSGNKEVLSNKDLLLKIFQDDLKHEDTYIYLLAINGLAAMANMFPDIVIPSLVSEFDIDRKGKNNMNCSNLKLKIGEVLVKVSGMLDANSTKFVPSLIHTFLRGIKNSDPLIKMSSLSNLGQVCQKVGFRIQSVVYEVLVCVEMLMKFDREEGVRAAAASVLTQLLCGLGSDAFTVLNDELIHIYRNLKFIYQKEESETVKLNVQLALEELKKITSAFLFPEPKFQKMLEILDISC